MRKRNTLAKKIREAKEFEKREIARWDRLLSPIERAAYDYLTIADFRDEWAASCKAKLSKIIFDAIDTALPSQNGGCVPRHENREQMARARAMFRITPAESERFASEQRARKSEAGKLIQELASFVENYPFKEQTDFADPRREKILLLKEIAVDGGCSPFVDEINTVRGLANFLKVKITADGCRQLRALCKELGFPLVKAKKLNKPKKRSSKS